MGGGENAKLGGVSCPGRGLDSVWVEDVVWLHRIFDDDALNLNTVRRPNINAKKPWTKREDIGGVKHRNRSGA